MLFYGIFSALVLRGVLFTPNAESVFSGQAGQQQADAQFGLANPGGSSPGSFSGIAVVANGSSVATGQWQYFNSNTSTWVDIGSSYLPGELVAAFLAAQMDAGEDITRRRLALWDRYHAWAARHEASATQ